MYVKLSYFDKHEWFVIDSINDSISDDDEMEVNCFSLPYELKRKKIFSEIDLGTVTIREVLENTLLLDTGWKLGSVATEFSELYRNIKISNGDKYNSIIEVAESFGAVLDWNSDNKTINILFLENTLKNKGLIINSENLLNSLSRERTTENILTRMYIYGNENMSVENVNPTGQRYIEDFSYFVEPFERDSGKNILKHSYYMSDALCHALLDIKELSNQILPQIKSKQTDITNKLSSLSEIMIEVIEAENKVGILKGLLDVAKATGDASLTSQRQSELDLAESQLNVLMSQQSSLEGQIEALNVEIASMQKQIDTTSFTEELKNELAPFIIEGEFKDDRYIDETELYNDAVKEFIKNRDPKQVLKVDLTTVLNDPENIYYRDKINLGDLATVRYPNANIDFQEPIVSISIDFDEFDIKLDISEHDDDLEPLDRLVSLIYDTSSSMATLEGNKYKWDTIINIKNIVDEMRDGVIDATRNRIIAGVNESVNIGSDGIILTNPDFPNDMIIMQSGVIALSQDGGKNWDTSVTAKGIMADTIIGRLLVGNELIISNDSGSFVIDSNGLTVDIDSIKIMSGESGTPEDMIQKWNSVLSTVADMTNDGVLNEYEKNQLEKQFLAEKTAYSEMIKAYKESMGPETPENQYSLEFDNLVKAYEDMNTLLNVTLQSDGFAILDINNRTKTTTVDPNIFNSTITGFTTAKEVFLVKTPMDFTATAIEQTKNYISLNYVKNGEVVNEINLSEDGVKIDGSKVEISGDTTFKDDLIMSSGKITSSDGTSFVIDMNNNRIDLGKTLYINGNVVLTSGDVANDVVKTTKVYGESMSPLTQPTIWTETPPAWKDGYYIWELSTEHLRNGTTRELEPVNITGAKGATGANGLQGKPGENGLTPYFHVAYANSADGTLDFDTTDSTNRTYLGQYTDFKKEDSTNPSDYTWTRIKGQDGGNFTWNMIQNGHLDFSKITYSVPNHVFLINRIDAETEKIDNTILKFYSNATNSQQRIERRFNPLELGFYTYSVRVRISNTALVRGRWMYPQNATHIDKEEDIKVGEWQTLSIPFEVKKKDTNLNVLKFYLPSLENGASVEFDWEKLEKGTNLNPSWSPHIDEIYGANGSNFTWNLIKNSKTNVVLSNNNVTVPIAIETLTEDDNPFVRIKRTNTTSLPTRMSLFSNFYFDKIDKMYANKRYTFSFEARASHEATATYWSQYRDRVAEEKTTTISSLSTTIANKNMGLKTTWDTFSITFTMPNDTDEKDIINLAPIVTIPEGEIDNFYLDLRNWKLEDGENKNPSWTPHESEIQGEEGVGIKHIEPLYAYSNTENPDFVANEKAYKSVDLFDKTKLDSLPMHPVNTTLPLLELVLSPNTQYTLSTNIPKVADGVQFDLFFDLHDMTASSGSNGVAINAPRTLTSDETGKVWITFRSQAFVDKVISGEYWVKLEEGSEATPRVEDIGQEILWTSYGVGKNLINNSLEERSRSGSTNINWVRPELSDFNEPIGTELIFSYDIKASHNYTFTQAFFLNNDNKPAAVEGNEVTQFWKRKNHPFKWAGGAYNGKSMAPHIYSPSTVTNYVRRDKLEFGDVVTPYTISPADHEARKTEYLWERQMIIFTDGRVELTEPSPVHLAKDGAPGKGIKDTRYRYAKTSAPSPEPTESQWSPEKPEYLKGDYAWTQVIWEYTDGTVENSAPMMSYIAEDGVGISNTLVAYALSTTNVQPADNLFSPEVPDSKPGDYVWTRVTLDYTDPNKTDSKFYTVARVGRDGVDAKLISLSASEQVFKNNTPATITVTGLAQNTSITSWTYSSNSGAFTTTLPAGVTRSGNTVTITQSTMTANTLTIKASDGTYSDTVSIAKLADGISGTDGFTVLLTNESQTFPANSSGTVTSYAGGYSDVIAYYGGTQLICTTTATGLPTVNNTYTVTAITATTGTVTLTPSLDSSNYRITPSALTTDNAIRVLTIVARVNNTNYTFKKTLTYTKSKNGEPGPQGAQGKDGEDGYTPYEQNGTWWINGQDTGIEVRGENGVGITSYENYYKLTPTTSKPTNTSETGWSNIAPLTTSTDKYLWMYSKIQLSNGEINRTSPAIISMFSESGKSAYDLAKEQGYSGTLNQWIESLKGAKGDDGAIRGTTPPTDLTKLWLDESVTPAKLKFHDGSDWVPFDEEIFLKLDELSEATTTVSSELQTLNDSIMAEVKSVQSDILSNQEVTNSLKLTQDSFTEEFNRVKSGIDANGEYIESLKATITSTVDEDMNPYTEWKSGDDTRVIVGSNAISMDSAGVETFRIENGEAKATSLYVTNEIGFGNHTAKKYGTDFTIFSWTGRN